MNSLLESPAQKRPCEDLIHNCSFGGCSGDQQAAAMRSNATSLQASEMVPPEARRVLSIYMTKATERFPARLSNPVAPGSLGEGYQTPVILFPQKTGDNNSDPWGLL